MHSPTRPLTAADPVSRRSVFVAVLGDAVKFFDFGVYAAFVMMIGRTFFPSNSAFVSPLLSTTAFGVGLVIRPLGAVLIGIYADRAGYKPATLLTLFLMALGTDGIAVLPGYDSTGPTAPLLLMLTRLLQGLAWGSEVGLATIYVLEAAPPHKRGTYAYWQVVAQGIAAVVTGLMGYLFALWFDERQLQEWGWQVPFVAGPLVLPIGLCTRLNLAETLSGCGRQADTRSPFDELFGNYRWALLPGLLILSGSTITQHFLNYTTTFAFTELHLPAGIAILSTLTVGAALTLLVLFGSVPCDRCGRRVVLVLPCLALLAVLFPALQTITCHPEPTVFLVVFTLLSALYGTSGATLVVLLIESSPRALRSISFSLAYAAGAVAFGGAAQIVVTWSIGVADNPLSPLGYLLLASLVCSGGTWLAREAWPGRRDMAGAPLVLRG